MCWAVAYLRLSTSAVQVTNPVIDYATCSALHPRQWGADSNTEQHGHALVSSTAGNAHDTLPALPYAVPGSASVSRMADGMAPIPSLATTTVGHGTHIWTERNFIPVFGLSNISFVPDPHAILWTCKGGV